MMPTDLQTLEDGFVCLDNFKKVPTSSKRLKIVSNSSGRKGKKSKVTEIDHPRFVIVRSGCNSKSSREPSQHLGGTYLNHVILGAIEGNHSPGKANIVFNVGCDLCSLQSVALQPPNSSTTEHYRPVSDSNFEGVIEYILNLQYWRQFEFKKQVKAQVETFDDSKRSLELGSGANIVVQEFESPQQHDIQILMTKAMESKETSVVFQCYLEKYTSEDIKYLTSTLDHHVSQLIVHPFGSYILQKLCQIDAKFKHILIDFCMANLTFLSSNEYSSRVMQVIAENTESFRLRLFRDAADNFSAAIRSMSWVLLLSACVRAAQKSEEYDEPLFKMTQNAHQRADSKTYYFKLVVSVVRVCSQQALGKLYQAFRSIMNSPNLFGSKNRLLILSSILNRKYLLAIQDFQKTLCRIQNHQIILESPHLTYFIDKLKREDHLAEFASSPLALLYAWLKSHHQSICWAGVQGPGLGFRTLRMRQADRTLHFYYYVAALVSPPASFARFQLIRQSKANAIVHSQNNN
jgi:hypothetical protein